MDFKTKREILQLVVGGLGGFFALYLFFFLAWPGYVGGGIQTEVANVLNQSTAGKPKKSEETSTNACFGRRFFNRTYALSRRQCFGKGLQQS